ncbi:hypothetical protein PYCCODRAFT_1011440 [Trametes coccinea BRFM310]|uniref:Uncharacterized protein n=1 Tax=Trametes coccinea (strain BRFM310) TaxID=1353009 RepID=A0A1Y2IAU2_TRAC3|nr:hypothetical protein PYCCODRAFT_1011440 [Trametes coccinea BRFM310]
MPSQPAYASQRTGPHPPNNLFKRFASKLRSSSAPHPSASSSQPSAAAISAPKRIASQTQHSAAHPQQPTPSKKRSGLRMPPLPKAPVPAAPPNDFTSLEQRQAALRARGLLPNVPPAYRDANGYMVPLSEQEKELDRRFAVVVGAEGAGAAAGRGESAAESEARKIKEAWLARNRDAAGGAAQDAAAESGGAQEKKQSEPASVVSNPPDSPSEKVSRWLRSSSDTPTPTSPSQFAQSQPDAASTPLSESPRTSLSTADSDADAETPQAASPAGTVRGPRQRKEKPAPIVVAPPSRSSKESAGGKSKVAANTTAQVVAVAVSVASGPSDSEGSTCDTDVRGRPAPHLAGLGGPPRLSHADSSTSTESSSDGRSRGMTLPALSPTRTVSSSGAESTLPTPTTASCVRADVSVAHSSEQSHGSGRRGSGSAARSSKTKVSAGAGGLVQSSIEESEVDETSSSSSDGEFGVGGVPAQSVPVPAPAAARPRPPRLQTPEQAAEAQGNRKSFSLFGKKSSTFDSSAPGAARGSSSMSNLRRAFTGGLAAKLQVRPRSTLNPAPAELGAGGQRRTKMFDASHLPASPTRATAAHAPPSSFPAAYVPLQGRTPGVGPRPRQAVAPTMHSRGSILHQAHFIEDDESRRLSEMAFLT